MARISVSELQFGEDSDILELEAKKIASNVTLQLTGNVTGTVQTDFTQGSTTNIATTIAANAVTNSTIADNAVTTTKITDGNVTLDKIADSAKSGSVADNDGKLATHAQVKSAIDTAISGQGAYLGKQTVATINTWVAANLHNGDRAICSDSGTLTLGNLPVRAGEDVIFWKSGETAIWQSMDGEFKLKQTAKSDPTASGTTLTAIATITQDANGEITATKKTIQDATTGQKGVMKVGTGLTASSGTVSVSYGTAAGTACQGNDSRLSDSRTPKSHTHGNIQNSGALQTTDVTIASGDKLVVTDASNSNLVARTSVSFDGSTTTTALTPKGTFESFAKAADITSAIQALDVGSQGGDGKYISAISETDGKISATATTMDTTPTASSTKAVTSGGVKSYVDAKTFLDATVLTSTDNLNTLYASDENHVRYYSWNSNSAPTNAPASGSAVMEVKWVVAGTTGAYSRQDVWLAGGEHHYRLSNNGTWGSWQRIYEVATNSYSSSGTQAVNGTAVAAAINELDATITSTDGTNVQVKVTETNGKVTAVNITTDNTESKSNKVTAWSSTTTDTHYPSEKLVKTALDGKQATLVFDGTYNSSTNKAATVSSVTSRINALDKSDTAVAGQVVSAVSETDGIITVSRRALVAGDIPDISGTYKTKQTSVTGGATKAVTSQNANGVVTLGEISLPWSYDSTNKRVCFTNFVKTT